MILEYRDFLAIPQVGLPLEIMKLIVPESAILTTGST